MLSDVKLQYLTWPGNNRVQTRLGNCSGALVSVTKYDNLVLVKRRLGHMSSYWCNEWPSVLWRCWLGGRKGIRPVKIEWWGASMVICLELGGDLHMAQLMPLPLTVSCFSKIQIGFTFLVPAHPGSPRTKGPLNVCVCVCVCVWCNEWRHCVVVRRLTLLLRCGPIRFVVSWTPTRRVHRARGVGGGVCNAPLPCLQQETWDF